MSRPWSLVFLILCLSACAKSPPPREERMAVPASPPDTAAAVASQPEVDAELFARYLAQLRQALAVEAIIAGEYPPAVEPVVAMLLWRPSGSAPAITTITPEGVGGLARDGIGYVPPSGGSPAVLWSWEIPVTGGEPVLSSEPLRVEYGLAMQPTDLTQGVPPIAEMLDDKRMSGQEVAMALLRDRAHPAIARAARADAALRLMLEWTAKGHEGRWPRNRDYLEGLDVIKMGSVPGLEVWLDWTGKRALSYYTDPEAGGLVLITQSLERENGTAALVITKARAAEVERPKLVWRLM